MSAPGHRSFRLAAVVSLFIVTGLCGCSLLKPKPKTLPASPVQGGSPAASAGKLREKTSPKKEAPPPPPVVSPATVSAPQSSVVTNHAVAPKAAYRMRAGDPIIIFLRDLPEASAKEQQLEGVIDDTGYVNLPFIGRMLAAGKTTSELEQEIEKKYIDEKIYLRLTANVVIPQQYIFVTGEVKQSNKFPLVSGMTMMQAVAAAGGFTEYADAEKIQLIRGGKTTVFKYSELNKHPENDIPLEAGDRVVVPRSWY